MIFEGLKLMLVGMTTVLLFLIAMIMLIQLVSYLTRGVAQRELEAIEEERKQKVAARQKKKATAGNADEDIAVIAAAVAAFEAERYA